jgi:hypothetical protein
VLSISTVLPKVKNPTRPERLGIFIHRNLLSLLTDKMFTKALIALCAATLASAHMEMNTPQPYGRSSLNNSPLEASGSDFPCKQRGGVYDLEGASNVYALGSTNPLKFTGQAVHGGGSCQVSITYDAQPNKNSVWKVIKSIEGGCPARGEAGNMGDNAGADDPYTYDFTIPADIPAGTGTIAWTWFNKIGNREMYMNCGPVTLTGTGGSEAAYNALPDMFVANIGNGCGTPSGTDLLFPNPGAAVEKLNGATDAFAAPTGSCPAGNGGAGGGSGGGNGGAAPTTKKSSPTTKKSSPPTTARTQPSKTALPGGVFVPVESDEPASPPATTAPPKASPSATPGNGGSGNGSGNGNGNGNGNGSGSGSGSGSGGQGAQAAGTACSEEGMWNCVGGTSFQRCASGAWSPVQQLAAGTSCTPGQSANINMVVVKRNGRKRALRFRA